MTQRFEAVSEIPLFRISWVYSNTNIRLECQKCGAMERDTAKIDLVHSGTTADDYTTETFIFCTDCYETYIEPYIQDSVDHIAGIAVRETKL